MSRKLVWRRWLDPFKLIVDKAKALQEEDDEDHSHFKGAANAPDTYRGPVLVTPNGMLPLTEGGLPSKNFNIWVGDANFDLSRPVVRAIGSVSGVERLRLESRYSFWMGIGRAFDENQVKLDVEKAVGAGVEPKAQAASVESYCSFLRNRYQHWVVIQFEDGHIEDFVGEEQTMKNKAQEHEQTAKRVVASWDRAQKCPEKSAAKKFKTP